MNDRNLARGLLLAFIALAFGLNALRYGIGTLSHAGPGLFPLIVSSMLLAIALANIVRSRIVPPLPLNFGLRNIALLIAALVAFALLSKFVNMIAGIVGMVLIASLASASRSLTRSLKIAAGLVVVAFAFKELLGLSLPLY